MRATPDPIRPAVVVVVGVNNNSWTELNWKMVGKPFTNSFIEREFGFTKLELVTD